MRRKQLSEESLSVLFCYLKFTCSNDILNGLAF